VFSGSPGYFPACENELPPDPYNSNVNVAMKEAGKWYLVTGSLQGLGSLYDSRRTPRLELFLSCVPFLRLSAGN